jgi:hypothetical protein
MDGWADRRTDKNRQTIAVTLCLRFAASVNEYGLDTQVHLFRQHNYSYRTRFNYSNILIVRMASLSNLFPS